MAEDQAQEQMEEVLDYNEEQAAEQMDAAPADAAAEVQADAAADSAQADAAPSGDAPQQEKAADAPEPGKVDPLSQPPHGTEVYASNIPMEATEEQVKSFFAEMGDVFQLRLPKNPDGRNRGFGFVVYKTKEAAANAVEHLNGKSIPNLTGPAAERKVRVNQSQVKNKLYVGNLPRGMTQFQVEEELKQLVVGLEALELMMDKENPECNRGFGFLTFYNYACAEAARRKLAESEYQMGGRPLTITWAEPKKEEDTSRVRAIYVGNLPESVNEDKLRGIFKAYGEIDRVMLPYSKDESGKYRDYGFVHYKERASALEAVARSEDDKPVVDGKELTVHMAKPQHEVHQSGYGGYGSGGRGGYGQQGYGGHGQQGYGGYGQGRGRGGYGRGGGRGYGRGRGYGAASAGYASGGYGEEEYADEGYGEEAGYGAATAYAGYGAAAAAPAAAAGATMMMPVQLPNGQVGYMVMPTAGAAGAGGPMRRGVAAGYGAAGYGAGAATGYGARSAGGYAASGRSTGYGAQGGRAGAYRPY